MGSFNSQCFISRQILSSYDGAYIVPIIQNPKTIINKIDNNSIINYFNTPDNYSDSEFVLYSYLISCTYDDYGRYDINETENNKTSLKHLFDNLYQELADIEESEGDRNPKSFKIRKVYNPSQSYSIKKLIGIFNVLVNEDLFHDQKLFIVKEKKVLSMNISSISKYTLEYAQKTKYKFEDYYNKFNFKEKTVKDFISLNGLIKNVKIDLFEDLILEKEIEDIINKEEENKIEKIKEKLENRINIYLLKNVMKEFNIVTEPVIYSGQDYDNETGRVYYNVLNSIKKQEV